MNILRFLTGLVIGLIVALVMGYFNRQKLANLGQSEAAARQQLAGAQSKLKDLEAALANEHASHQAAIQQANTRSESVREDEVQEDDLTVIEGIGPKISALLNQAGIHSFSQLGQTRIERLREILDAGGPNFRLANPATWSVQAHLAEAGLLDELKALQDVLSGGVKR